MAYRQKVTPNVNAPGRRGWCLEYVDNSVSATKRTPSAQAAYNNEKKAKRIRTSTPPKDVWVIGFLAFTKGIYAHLGHVYLMKYLGNGRYEIRDTEVRSGVRAPYRNINELLAWFGAYAPKYTGWSTHVDGRAVAEQYVPKPSKKPAPNTKRLPAKGTATVIVSTLNVRDSPTTKGKVVATYKKGQTFKYDSYQINAGYVWLSYRSWLGKRRYVAEGPNDGKENTVFVKGGV